MTTDRTDPWTAWYAAYLADRTALRAARLSAQERRRVCNVMAGLLVGYMVVGGLVASLAVGLVLAH